MLIGSCNPMLPYDEFASSGPDFDCSMVPGRPAQGHRWVFDMGDNMAGFATLTLPRSALVANQAVSLKYAEVLKSDGSVDMAWCAEGAACQCSGINCANQTDTFFPAPPTHADDTSVTYTPTFTYHGFRYVQVEGTVTSGIIFGLFLDYFLTVCQLCIHHTRREMYCLFDADWCLKSDV